MYSGVKESKDRVAVLFRANAKGEEKLPLFINGKALKPRFFRNARLLNGINYCANRAAWMTATCFKEYVRTIYNKMAKKNRKLLFILGNCPGHSKIENLKTVTIEFLPANITSVMQPIDQCCIEGLDKSTEKAFSTEFGLMKMAKATKFTCWEQNMSAALESKFVQQPSPTALSMLGFHVPLFFQTQRKQRQMTSQTLRNSVKVSSSEQVTVPPKHELSRVRPE